MSQQIGLREAEKRALRGSYNDGLWDILLGCVFLMFAVAPLLSASLGDFWSSVVFLPFWGLAYLAIRLVRIHLVAPRLGVVKLGRSQKRRLARFSLLMFVMNIIAFILGVFAAFNLGRIPGVMSSIALGLILLAGFSMAAHILDYGRLYLYGLMIGLSPPVGEWLFVHGRASHHGFPLTFGITAALMVFTGLIVFLRLLHRYPPPREPGTTEIA